MVIQPTLQATGKSLFDVADHFGSSLYIRGVIFLSQGFLLTSMIFSTVMVFMTERKFLKAAEWLFAASAFSFIGLIHGYRLTAAGGLQNNFSFPAAPEFGILYLLVGVILLLLHYRQKSDSKPPRRGKKGKKAPKADDPGLNKVNNVGYV